MKQTAVQWLEQEFIKLESTVGVHHVMYELIEQAKAMEKEQSKTDYETGQASTKFKFPLPAEQYYQETYERKTI
jgi:hypothetical protein